MIARLIAKLEREYLETVDPKHRVEELAYRRGHNDRNKSLIAWLKVEAGLVEIAEAKPIDLRVKHELTGFDTSDQDGEG